MTRVGFILKRDHLEPRRLLHDLVPWLLGEGHEAIVMAEDKVGPQGARVVPGDDLATEIDLAVVLGGDGTMLRANALVGDAGVPIVGINLGRLGFLTHFDPDQAQETLAAALRGDLAITERMRLEVHYLPEAGEPIRRTALNDVVVNQGAMARMIELEARLDDDFIATYRADGLIVATPTGSTAYNLAAGGPIVFAGHRAMTITPICAHALTNRPLVVPHDHAVAVQLGNETSSVLLTIDGQWAHSFGPSDRVVITTADKPLKIYGSSAGYFDILRQKLHWGVRPVQ